MPPRVGKAIRARPYALQGTPPGWWRRAAPAERRYDPAGTRSTAGNELTERLASQWLRPSAAK